MQLQQPNIVGNFLNAYQSGLERQEAQKEAERQRLRQDRADQMNEQRFGMEIDEGQLNMALRRGAALNDILAGVDERNPQTLEMAKQRYLTTFGGKPEDVAQITMADIPRIKLQTGQTLKELELQLTRARIGTEQEQGRAARALATQRYAAARGGGGAGGGATGVVSNELIDNEAKVRGEYTGQLKDFVSVRDAFGRVAAAAEDPSAAGDLALIFNYMKMLDPGSVVREQEFANAQNAAGVPERVRAAYNNALRGERLTDNTRADFLDRAGRLFSTQLNTANKTREVYGSLADQYGFSRDRVTPDLSLGVTSDIIRPRAAPVFTGSGLLGGPGVNYTPPAQPSAANESTSQLYERADKLLRGIK
jgi:hypothetical protein